MNVFSIRSIIATLVPWLCDPTDVAGCVYWLRASVGVETEGPQGRVKSWTDQVAHWPVGPVNAAHAPVHLDFAATLNGLPGIGFYVDSVMLHKVGGVVLPWDEQPFSVFSVCSPENEGAVNAMIAQWAGTAPHVGMGFSSVGEFQGWVEALYPSGSKPKQYAPHVVGIVYNGLGTLKLYVDGALAATAGGLYAAAQDAGDKSVLAIGADTSGGYVFQGHIGDVVIYDRALDDDDLKLLNAALMAHYKMIPSWLSEVWARFAGAARGVFGLIGEELRHLLGDAGSKR